MITEALAWKHVSHPNVAELIGVSGSTEDSYDGNVPLVFPWLSKGSVREYITASGGTLPGSHVIHLVRQLHMMLIACLMFSLAH